MIVREQLERIRERYGSEYLLRQLAEECAELSTAALHHIRAKRHEICKSQEETILSLMEEMADVTVMLSCVRKALLSEDQRLAVDTTAGAKANRMVNRLLGGNWNE